MTTNSWRSYAIYQFIGFYFSWQVMADTSLHIKEWKMSSVSKGGYAFLIHSNHPEHSGDSEANCFVLVVLLLNG